MFSVAAGPYPGAAGSCSFVAGCSLGDLLSIVNTPGSGHGCALTSSSIDACRCSHRVKAVCCTVFSDQRLVGAHSINYKLVYTHTHTHIQTRKYTHVQ